MEEQKKDVLILAIETAYDVWWCCAGNCIKKTYRKNKYCN